MPPQEKARTRQSNAQRNGRLAELPGDVLERQTLVESQLDQSPIARIEALQAFTEQPHRARIRAGGFGDAACAGDLAQRGRVDELGIAASGSDLVQTAMARDPDQPPPWVVDAAEPVQAPDCIYEYLLCHIGRLGGIAEYAPAVTKHVVVVKLPQDLDGPLVVAGGQRCGQ